MDEMLLPATVETMGLVENQGARWIPVDDPRKSLEDEIFQYLHGNVYYSQQFELGWGYYMVAFGSVSMTLDIDGPGGADVRMRPDGKMVVVNSREKLDFIWNCFFAQEPFITQEGLHPSVEEAWSNLRKSKWDERPMDSYRPWEEPEKVDLEFIGRPKNHQSRTKPKKPKLAFSRGVSKGSAEFQEACSQLGKQRHFESRNLKEESEKRRFMRTLQSIVELCFDMQGRFPSETFDTTKLLGVPKVFYLPGPDG